MRVERTCTGWLAAACCALASCKGGNGDSVSDATPTIDAPAVPEVDAPIGGAIDASEVGRVDLKVLSYTGDGAPNPQSFAIFMDETGAVVQNGVVDANGDAHASLPGGGAVTVLQIFIDHAAGDAHQETITTIKGVKPGDHLLVGSPKSPTYFGGSSDTMTADITLPAQTNVASLLTPCGSVHPHSPPDGTATLTFFDSCSTPTFDMLSLAQDTSSVVRYVWQSGVSHTPDGTVSVPDAWQPMAHSTTTLEHVPAGLQRVAAFEYVLVGRVPTEMDRQAVELPPAGTNAVSLQYPPNTTDGTVLSVQTVQGIAVLERMAMITHASPASLTIDFARLPVTKVTGRPTQTATGAIWTQASNGAPDARFVDWSAHWADPSGVNHNVSWRVMEDPQGPAGTSLPPLPADYAIDDPAKADDPSMEPNPLHLTGASVTYVDYDNLAGYDAARPYGMSLTRVDAAIIGVDYLAHASFSP
jgi:hypothetical protein